MNDRLPVSASATLDPSFDRPTPLGRDPVVEALERLFRDLEKEGEGTLETSEEGGICRVRFAGESADAPTYDIALVRMASVLIDKPAYCQMIVEVLRARRPLANS